MAVMASRLQQFSSGESLKNTAVIRYKFSGIRNIGRANSPEDIVMRGLNLLIAGGLGAGLMYFLDPARGRRRRRLLRDKAVSAVARINYIANKTGRDVCHRTMGLAAKASSLARGHREVSDEVLAERVRSKI